MRAPHWFLLLLALSAGANTATAQSPTVGIGKLSVLPPEKAPPGIAGTRAAGKPRALPAKEPLHLPPGSRLRLLVKFRDGLKARAANSGELVVHANTAKEVEALAIVVRGGRMSFRATATIADAKIEALRQRAAERTGVEPPDLAGLLEVAVEASATRAQVIQLAEKFHRLAEVEYVQLESIDQPPPPPAADIAPPSGLLVSYQSYRTASGINADAAWTKYGVRGHGVRFTDCEYQYNPNHEDLSGLVTLQSGIASMYTGFGPDHGTAALGEVAAAENTYGMTGLAPAASYYFYPEFSTRTNGTTQNRSAAVLAAIADSDPGDVVMLEMQANGPGGSGKYVPAEYELAVWNAVKTGSDAGVIVVAAAGNGAENLDSAAFAAYQARGDSGAIIVGAGNSSRARLSFSTYGARVNLQGWGTGVATLGYGVLQQYGGDTNQAYTAAFSGTSSATPIGAGAVVLVQSLARETIGRSLTPAEMRQLLIDTGKAQTGTVAEHIGPLPDLQTAFTQLYIRFPLNFTVRSGWGRYYFGTPTPSLSANGDNDQNNNLLEYFFGTNPTANLLAQQSRWPAFQRVGNRVRLTFSNSPNLTDIAWAVQASGTLLNNSWQPLAHGVNGVTILRNGETVQIEAPLSSSQQFFQLKVTPLSP